MSVSLSVESHPLEPFLPPNGRILFLGSFPPPRKRWSMEFYYPNLQNDFWRVVGLVFFGEKDYFLEGKRFGETRVKDFCREKGLAFFDTARSVVRHRGNASDLHLEVVEPVDLDALLDSMPSCILIAVTGQKATDTLLGLLREHEAVEEPAIGHSVCFTRKGRTMQLFRMPSTSRAYPKPLQEKAEIYRNLFRQAGLVC